MARRMSYAAHLADDNLVIDKWGAPKLSEHRPSCYRDEPADWSPGQSSPSTFVIVDPADDSDLDAPDEYPSENEYFRKMREEQARLVVNRRTLKLPLLRNRRLIERLAAGLVAVVVIWTTVFGSPISTGLERAKLRFRAPPLPLRSATPLHSFRSNLRSDTGYITSFPYGGLSTQLLEVFKLVYLGQHLDRSAILPELKAEDDEGGDVRLSKFFDLRAFAYYSRVKIAEWQDVKIPDAASADGEQLSCWGWRDEKPLDRYNINTNFWPPPGQQEAPTSLDHVLTLASIEEISTHEQTPWLDQMRSKYYGGRIPGFPDHQLLCFENLYFVPSVKVVEGKPDSTFSLKELEAGDPVWEKVGRHLHFSPAIDRIADDLVKSLLGSSSSKYIAVHIRGDLEDDDGRQVHSAESLVSAFEAAEKVVQDEVALKKRAWSSKEKLPVIFTTDSDDPNIVKRLHRLGWLYIDHAEFATVQRFGGWHPAILDAVILSRGTGLVGTKGSTFSHLAARRVASWNCGTTVFV